MCERKVSKQQKKKKSLKSISVYFLIHNSFIQISWLRNTWMSLVYQYYWYSLLPESYCISCGLKGENCSWLMKKTKFPEQFQTAYLWERERESKEWTWHYQLSLPACGNGILQSLLPQGRSANWLLSICPFSPPKLCKTPTFDFCGLKRLDVCF